MSIIHHQLSQMRHFLLAARVFGANRRTRDLGREVTREFRQLFGRFDPLAWVALAFAAKEQLRL